MSRKIKLNRNSSRRLAGIAGLTGLAIAALTAVSLTSMTVSAQTGLGAVALSQHSPQNVRELRPAINEARAGTPRQARVIPLFNTPDDQKNLLRR